MDSKTRSKYIIDLSPFFSKPREFLDNLRARDFAPHHYDCSVQVAIRLMRWHQHITLTPRQNAVMNAIVTEAIRRSAANIMHKINLMPWSMFDHHDDLYDMATSAATKSLQHFAESHDFAVTPHPNIVQFINIHTNFISRYAIEDFIYRKRLKSEKDQPINTSVSKSLVESNIRARRSELKKLSGSEYERKSQELRWLTSVHHGISHEVRIDYMLERDDDDNNTQRHLSAEDQIALAYNSSGYDYDEDCDTENDDFLDAEFEACGQNIEAKTFIDILSSVKECRAVKNFLKSTEK